MTVDQVPHGPRQSRRIQRTGQPHGDRNVVDPGFRLEPVEEPHSLLRQRQRDSLGTFLRDERHPPRVAGVSAQSCGQGLDRRHVEQQSYRHYGVQGLTEP